MDLAEVKSKKLDLYRTLGFDINDKDALEATDLSEVTKQFRKLSLIYHPDKSNLKDSEDVRNRWDLLQTAYQILIKHKSEYDAWFSQSFLRGNKELLAKLEFAENSQKENDGTSYTQIEPIQQYGQTLRKLLHFKITSIDWRDPQFSEVHDSSHKFAETCLFRIKLVKRSEFSSEDELNKWFKSIDLPLDLEYYSDNNDQRENDLVIYASARDVPTTLNIIKTLKDEKSYHPDILEIKPAVDFEHFSFSEKEELNPGLQSVIFNSPDKPIVL
ncbi:U2-type spliceosomal complex subunit cwc23 [Kluyveromyces marxianus]|nr:U2-type spliceosomal complex subunit cwc23 [Kluyveromyces marxianus]KAG0680049.1 U2-type spliceosomal complex subunit cwc23 [Kluyveromyces marxianus]